MGLRLPRLAEAQHDRHKPRAKGDSTLRWRGAEDRRPSACARSDRAAFTASAPLRRLFLRLRVRGRIVAHSARNADYQAPPIGDIEPTPPRFLEAHTDSKAPRWRGTSPPRVVLRTRCAIRSRSLVPAAARRRAAAPSSQSVLGRSSRFRAFLTPHSVAFSEGPEIARVVRRRSDGGTQRHVALLASPTRRPRPRGPNRRP